MPEFPQEIHALIADLQRQQSPETCLRMAYDALTERFYGNRMRTILRLWELYPRSISKIWAKPGFLHCTNFNRLLKTLLVASGHFREADMHTRWTLLWYISPHQYLRVRVGGRKWMSVDAWAKVYGIPFGDHAHGWHVYGKGRMI